MTIRSACRVLALVIASSCHAAAQDPPKPAATATVPLQRGVIDSTQFNQWANDGKGGAPDQPATNDPDKGKLGQSPSKFGNVTLEAMACRLPVVAAEATGSESLVENHVNGRLIRPGAIHAFAEALRGYVVDADMRARHGLAGELRSLDFGWDRINRAVADTYVRLIRQKRTIR